MSSSAWGVYSAYTRRRCSQFARSSSTCSIAPISIIRNRAGHSGSHEWTDDLGLRPYQYRKHFPAAEKRPDRRAVSVLGVDVRALTVAVLFGQHLTEPRVNKRVLLKRCFPLRFRLPLSL